MNIGARVTARQGSKEMGGTIVGTASIILNEEIRFLYVVELDQGFYNEGVSVWVNLLLVDSDCWVIASD